MIRPVAIVVALALVLGACDRRAPVATTLPAREPVFELELKPLTPLLPNRPTHAAADSLGNLYWVQETDRGDDTLFVIGQGDIPRATQLSAGNIGALLNAADAKGNIQAIEAAPNGDIFFYFVGTQARRSLVCLGQFTPQSSRIRVLANDTALETATGMGRSLPLARGTIVGDSKNIWVWLRHSDASAIFRFDPRNINADGPIALTRAFDSIKLGDQPLPLTHEEYEISPAPDGNLFLLDLFASRILRIKPDGTATMVRSLVGLPTELSTPTTDRSGSLILFAAAVLANGQHADFIKPKTVEDTSQQQMDASFPALLVFQDDGKVIRIERDNIVAYPGFPTFKMRLRELVAYPREEAWVSYDDGSGELLRLKIREKNYH